MTKGAQLPCCGQGRKFVGLRHESALFYDSQCEGPEDFLQKMRVTPPCWMMHVQTFVSRHERALSDSARIAFCPFCGTKVPGVRLRRNPPKKICVVLDGGYYCATCEERLDSCNCALPAQLWEAAP